MLEKLLEMLRLNNRLYALLTWAVLRLYYTNTCYSRSYYCYWGESHRAKTLPFEGNGQTSRYEYSCM